MDYVADYQSDAGNGRPAVNWWVMDVDRPVATLVVESRNDVAAISAMADGGKQAFSW